MMDSIKLNINLSLEQLIEAVKQLSPLDKLKVNDAIWDDTNEIPIAHQKLVLDRIAKAEKNPKRLVDWNEALKTL